MNEKKQLAVFVTVIVISIILFQITLDSISLSPDQTILFGLGAIVVLEIMWFIVSIALERTGKKSDDTDYLSQLKKQIREEKKNEQQ